MRVKTDAREEQVCGAKQRERNEEKRKRGGGEERTRGGRGQSRFASWKCLYCVMYSNGGQPGRVLVFETATSLSCVGARPHVGMRSGRGEGWGWEGIWVCVCVGGVASAAGGSTLPEEKKTRQACRGSASAPLFTDRRREVRAVCVCFILSVQQPSKLASFIHSCCSYSLIFYIVSTRGMPLAADFWEDE